MALTQLRFDVSKENIQLHHIIEAIRTLSDDVKNALPSALMATVDYQEGFGNPHLFPNDITPHIRDSLFSIYSVTKQFKDGEQSQEDLQQSIQKSLDDIAEYFYSPDNIVQTLFPDVNTLQEFYNNKEKTYSVYDILSLMSGNDTYNLLPKDNNYDQVEQSLVDKNILIYQNTVSHPEYNDITHKIYTLNFDVLQSITGFTLSR